MRPTDELTMYAYGLLEPGEEAGVRAHVEGCPGCAERVGRLREEKLLLERAAGREPVHPRAIRNAVERAAAPPRAPRPRSLVPLALAAILLLGLAGVLLYRPTPAGRPADAGRRTAADPIDRLVAELRSPVALRREIAVFAITAHGQAAAPKIRKAQVDPGLFPELRWNEQDPKVLEILRKTKLDLSFEDERPDAIVQAIGEKIRLTIVVDPKDDPRWDPTKRMTFKVKDLTAENCLKLIGSQFGLNVFAEDGKVILSPRRHPRSARAPVRVGRRASADLVRVLESPSEDERLRAERELERLNFAAEEDLWAGLDTPIAHARERIARLLRRLYDETQACALRSSSAAVKAGLREKRMTCEYDNAPLTAVVDYWNEIHKIRIHIVGVDAPEDVSITFKGKDLALFEVVTLALEPHRLGIAVQDDVLVISPKDRIRPPRPGAPIWTSADEAARMEALLASLGSSDPAARRKAEQSLSELGERALAPIGEAARLLDLPLASQARALRDRILQEQKLWLLDAGSGAGIQELSDEQNRLLGGTLTLNVDDVPREDVLNAAVKTIGAGIDLRARPPGRISLSARDLPLEAVLKSLTRPYGLDYYLEGRTIVVDTAARVRAAMQ